MIQPCKKRKIGMKDLAEKLGVSVMTVSAALSGSGRVGESRKREIVELARRMGYQGNAAARLLKSKKLKDIGLLIFEKEELIRENAVFLDMTVQCMKECLRNNIPFQMEWFDSSKNSDVLPQIMTNGSVGGLLIAGIPLNASKDFIAESLSLPYVALEEDAAYSIRFDNEEALKQAIYYLVSVGHSNIGLINGPLDIEIFKKDREIFDATLRELSLLRPSTLHIENHPAENFRFELEKHIETFLKTPNRPTALVVHSGLFTKAFIAGLAKKGLLVPEDLSVICTQTLDWEAEKFYPPITAIEHRFEDLIVAGVNMLRDLMNGKDVAHPHVLISPAFTKRETVCPPRKK